MAREMRDSYTGEVYAEYYVSRIKGINEPKGLFKEREEEMGSSASYRADEQPDGTYQVSRCAHRGQPQMELCSVDSEAWAVRLLDWLVLHDRVMRKSLDLFMQDPEMFFNCVEQGMKETSQ